MAWDYAHKLSDRVVEMANEHSSTIFFENLNKLGNNVIRSSNFNKKLSLWSYREIEFTISYEALERRIEVKFVPMKTRAGCSRTEMRQ
ncbi:MAG: IS200/IS605 family accessory protein TnpB-related protein [Desulfurococcaceae archaeon]